MPCIIRFNNGENRINNKPAIPGTTAKMRKNVEMEYVSLMRSIKLPDIPARKFATALQANHTPKIRPTNFFGESLLT